MQKVFISDLFLTIESWEQFAYEYKKIIDGVFATGMVAMTIIFTACFVRSLIAGSPGSAVGALAMAMLFGGISFLVVVGGRER